jgi:hypothetical protein
VSVGIGVPAALAAPSKSRWKAVTSASRVLFSRLAVTPIQNALLERRSPLKNLDHQTPPGRGRWVCAKPIIPLSIGSQRRQRLLQVTNEDCDNVTPAHHLADRFLDGT